MVPQDTQQRGESTCAHMNSLNLTPTHVPLHSLLIHMLMLIYDLHHYPSHDCHVYAFQWPHLEPHKTPLPNPPPLGQINHVNATNLINPNQYQIKQVGNLGKSNALCTRNLGQDAFTGRVKFPFMRAIFVWYSIFVTHMIKREKKKKCKYGVWFIRWLIASNQAY